jgi:CSLREA domain-containing protein
VGRARTLAFCILAVLIATSIGMVLGAKPAHAKTITVTTTADDLTFNGNCTLREAVLAANFEYEIDACGSGSDNDTIVVPASPTPYTLTRVGAGEDEGGTGDLDLLDVEGVAIQGAGAGSTVIDAGGTPRVSTASLR